MPAFPRFIGGPTLGSNLGNVTTAKAALVRQFLRIIFPGIEMYMVQGSPSGSPASGGTHVDEIGDAGDWVYRYQDGRTVPLKVYLLASLLWRMLSCLSYIRGADVNKDGVKDDPFDLHNHIIDREGSPKAQAVRNQISQFLAHLDGLVGGRADREQIVPQPMTLAEYQTPAGQATFLLRFKALTSEAVSLPAHIEPPQEEPMSTFVQVKGSKTVYLTDGITARAVPDEQTLRDLYYLGGLLGIKTATGDGVILVATDVPVRVVANAGVLGTVVSVPASAPATTVTVNLDATELDHIAQAVWAPIRKAY